MVDRAFDFDMDSVRSILSGRKTQFRYPVRDQWVGWLDRDGKYGVTRVLGYWTLKPGRRLWVRETWKSRPNLSGVEKQGPDGFGVIYAATWDRAGGNHWRPSVHMPRWASRITLEVVQSRIERLQDITEEDACSEGVPCNHVRPSCEGVGCLTLTHRSSFWKWWTKIHGKKKPWDENPWVFVVSFRRVETV